MWYRLFIYGSWLFLLMPGLCNGQELDEKFRQLMFTNHDGLRKGKLKGHSHNDYRQDIPFLQSYYAGMQSIEADVFLRDGVLYVAHDATEIRAGRTLDSLYLRPLFARFRENGGYVFADKAMQLQLVIDIKENHRAVIPAVVEALEPYMRAIAPTLTEDGVHIVVSGDMPQPRDYGNFPEFIAFDGRPGIHYTSEQLKRVAMISTGMTEYTYWNGKGRLKEAERLRMRDLVLAAEQIGKPFRFWATPDSKNAWLELEKIGVTWVNTDVPQALAQWLAEIPYTRVQLRDSLPVYCPAFEIDGVDRMPKNIILLIGDGMGLAHVKAAMSANRGKLNMTQLRHVGFSRTESADAGNTDSGAGGSALATGYPARNGSVGVDTMGKPRASVSDQLAERKGIQVALISTGDMTDATPAAFYASHVDRNASEDIALQLLESSVSFIGGGKPGFFEDAEKREAYLRLANESGWLVTSTIDSINMLKDGPLVVMLPDSAIRPVKDGRGPILRDLVGKAINRLKESDNGFFLMAEGAQIDYGGHARDLNYVVTETLDFDQAVGEAIRFADADGETLVIVTADHETGGLSLLDVDENQGYVVGDFASNDHTNIMVPVFAYGLGAQHFRGIVRNTELLDVVRRWAGVH